MDDRAGQRPGDPLDRLDLGGDQLAELVHILRLGADDNVVRSGDILRLRDAGDLRDLPGHVGGFADLGLDEDVCLHHDVLLGARAGQLPVMCHGTLEVQTCGPPAWFFYGTAG